jgi:hypothetical protein
MIKKEFSIGCARNQKEMGEIKESASFVVGTPGENNIPFSKSKKHRETIYGYGNIKSYRCPVLIPLLMSFTKDNPADWRN